MSNLSICHYRCFAADKRMSMDVYAHSLATACAHRGLELHEFIPTSKLERFSASKSLMRYLRYWHYPNAVKGQNADIHHVVDHGYAHLLPKLNLGKTCVTVHDLIPMLHWMGQVDRPESEEKKPNKPNKPILNLRSLSYLKKFDGVIAVSNNTKQDLVHHLGIDSEKISVIPPVIASHFKHVDETQINELRRKYQLDNSSKWLMISGSEFYKNNRTSLAVLRELNQHSEEKFCLIKTGHLSDEFNQLVVEYDLVDNVRSLFLEDVTELATLYALVDTFLFPSWYEGFGMPVAEALACGTPVVTSNRGALPEVGGELSLKCAPDDVPQFARHVQSSVSDKELRQRVVNQGTAWVEQFRSATVGQKLERFYRDLSTSEMA